METLFLYLVTIQSAERTSRIKCFARNAAEACDDAEDSVSCWEGLCNIVHVCKAS